MNGAEQVATGAVRGVSWAREGRVPQNEFLRFLTRGARRPMEVPILMLTLYSDESGGGVFLFSGLLATREQWEAFYPAWNAVLESPPCVPYWHQTGAFAQTPEKPFRGLTFDQKCEKAKRLAAVVADMRPRWLCASLAEADYLAEVKGRIILPPTGDHGLDARRAAIVRMNESPYHLLHFALVEQLNRELAEMGDQPVRIILAASDNDFRDGANVTSMKQLCRLYTARGWDQAPPYIAHAPSNVPEYRPLEAADITAWTLRRRLTDTPPKDVCDILLSRLNPPDIRVTAEMMRDWVAGVLETEGARA